MDSDFFYYVITLYLIYSKDMRFLESSSLYIRAIDQLLPENIGRGDRVRFQIENR